MVERSAPWPPGTPNWVDLAADDAGAAARFYPGLFGRDCEPPITRDYWVCKIDGEEVGDIGPSSPVPSISRAAGRPTWRPTN